MTLLELFRLWRELPAFNARADESERLHRTALVLKPRSRAETTGHAVERGDEYEILIRIGYDVTDAHATLLHEMAHVYEGWRNGAVHTKAWRQRFIFAAADASGHSRRVLVAAAPRDHFAVHNFVRGVLANRRAERRA
jgi:hypothetical protein